MSKLPEMMSIVCPSEMMPITALAERMLTRFCGVRNTSESRLARSPIVMSRMKAMLPRAARATPRSQPHDPSSSQARASRPRSLRTAFIPPASPVRSGSRRHAISRYSPVAERMTISCVACCRENLPVMRPSCMTMTRSLIWSTSGRSEEISRMPTPARASSTISPWISALAPTSTPCVGSSRISTFGRVSNQRAITTRC